MNISLPIPFGSHLLSSDCWVIQNSPHVARRDLGLGEGEAARLALKALDKLKGTDAHMLSLMPAVHSLHSLQLLFGNLNKHLFREVLKDTVSFRFSSNLPPDIHGSTSALGALGNQIVISLNADLIRDPSHLALVASLIHQMSHAYLLVCCGFGDSSAADGRHDLKHGLAFSSIVHTIQDLLVDDARIPLPDLFTCGNPVTRSPRVPHHHPRWKSLHSYCHFNFSDHADKIACAAYMRHVIASAKPSRLGASGQNLASTNISGSMGTLEGLVNSAQTQYRHQLQPNLYPSLRLPVTSLTGAFGDIPTSGDYQALMNLQTFLAFGDYDPKIASVLETSHMAGPPRIHVDDKHKIRESSPTNPLHDLRTYVLALRMAVEPLRQLALVRLYSQRLLKKEINAMHFLEEIYTGSPSKDGGPGDTVKGYKPDEDLRRFVHAFLCAAHPDLPTRSPGVIQLEYEDTIFGRRVTSETDTEPATQDNTNLRILETTEKYKDRFYKLRGKGGLFLEDLDKVKDALDSKESIQPPDDILSTAAMSRELPVQNAANFSLANGVLGSRAVLERLEAADEQRLAHELYRRHLNRRPMLGLGGIPASAGIGDLLGDARLDDLERLGSLRL